MLTRSCMHAGSTNICGVLVGNLPSANQQNVFSGIPLELMPEEARLLVERKHAYVVDDVKMHSKGMNNLGQEERQKFRNQLEEEGLEAAWSDTTKCCSKAASWSCAEQKERR